MEQININQKLDLILQEMISFRKNFEQIDIRFNQIDEKFEQIDIRFEQIDKKFEQIDSRLNKLDYDNESTHKAILENINRLDRRITSLKSDNAEEHAKIIKYLDSINSAFLRYETDGTDKMRILFDSDIDRKNHQDIYGHEFKRLNDLVAKNSFRISNLEQHLQKN